MLAYRYYLCYSSGGEIYPRCTLNNHITKGGCIMNTFAKKLEELINKSGREVKVKETSVQKNNGTSLRAVVIVEEGTSFSPTIYYEESLSESENLRRMHDTFLNLDPIKKAPRDFLNKEYFLTHLTYKLINREMNENLLEDVPHTDFLDLAKVYVVDLSDFEDSATVLVRNSHLDALDITLEELEKNATIRFGFKCKNIGEYLADLTGMPTPAEMDEAPMYITSSQKGLFGAGLMADEESLHKVQDITGLKTFIILPSSIHEFIVIPQDMEKATLYAQMVREINQSEVSPEEVLSNNVYIYDGKKVVVA